MTHQEILQGIDNCIKTWQTLRELYIESIAGEDMDEDYVELVFEGFEELIDDLNVGNRDTPLFELVIIREPHQKVSVIFDIKLDTPDKSTTTR